MSFLQEKQRIHFETYPNVTLQACRFSPEFYSDRLFNELGINRPDFIDNYASSRRSEYIAGRYCAQTALANIGIFDTNVSKNRDKTPLWPDHVSGSISHSKNHAIAAVAMKYDYSAIGVDCESIISSMVRDEIKDMVANGAEQKLLSDSGIDVNTGITLALSIKESLFKAIFPS